MKRHGWRFIALPARRPASRMRPTASAGTGRSAKARTSRLDTMAKKASITGPYPLGLGKALGPSNQPHSVRRGPRHRPRRFPSTLRAQAPVHASAYPQKRVASGVAAVEHVADEHRMVIVREHGAAPTPQVGDHAPEAGHLVVPLPVEAGVLVVSAACEYPRHGLLTEGQEVDAEAVGVLYEHRMRPGAVGDREHDRWRLRAVRRHRGGEQSGGPAVGPTPGDDRDAAREGGHRVA